MLTTYCGGCFIIYSNIDSCCTPGSIIMLCQLYLNLENIFKNIFLKKDYSYRNQNSPSYPVFQSYFSST